MNENDKIWLSRESWETFSNALQNIQVRQTSTVLTPRITFSGTGKGAILYLDLPPGSSGGNPEYNSYFKIVDRSHTLEEDPDATYDTKLYKIAVCDGGSYNEETGTSGRSPFYLNDSYIGNDFPYMETEPFTGSPFYQHVYVEFKGRIAAPEVEEGEETEEFTAQYRVTAEKIGGVMNQCYFDRKTGILSCKYCIGRLDFPGHNSLQKTSSMRIIQDHLTGPLRIYWYISCFENEDE